MSDREQVSRPFTMAALLLIGLGCAGFLASWNQLPIAWSAEVALLVIAAVLSENYAVSLRGFSVSLVFPLAMAAAILGGPTAAGLVAAMGFTNIEEVRRRRPLRVLAFNLGQALIWGLAGGWAYALLAKQAGIQIPASEVIPATQIPWALAAIVLASLLSTFANVLLAGGGVSLLKRSNYVGVIRAMFAYLPTQMALGAVGLLIAQVLAISPMAFPLFLFPLFLARETYQRYAELRDAYIDTVRSLVSAMEAKDPYTSGHSARVAAYAVSLASHVGLEGNTIDRVERAALLHDIGKLAVPTSVLRKEDALSALECMQVREHPLSGMAFVQRIPPLKELAPLIGCHHERSDGSGYPEGLKGEQIPYEARLLAVADAYDAMTTDRPYRQAMSREGALAELLDCAGTQFDESLARAFVELNTPHEVARATTQRASSNQDVESAVGGVGP